MSEINDGDWVSLYKPNQYLASLRVAVVRVSANKAHRVQIAETMGYYVCRYECGKSDEGRRILDELICDVMSGGLWDFGIEATYVRLHTIAPGRVNLCS